MDNGEIHNWYIITAVSEMYPTNEFATVFPLYNDKQSFVSHRVGWYNRNPFQRIVDMGLVKCKWEDRLSINNRRNNVSFFVFMCPSCKLDFELDT